MNQAEFARAHNYSKVYVTHLKQAGRLVFNEDGSVNEAESLQKIEATADPVHDYMRVMHAEKKGLKMPANDDVLHDEGDDYKISRAMKAKYEALLAKQEYERSSGKLVNKADVLLIISDAMGKMGNLFDVLPTRVSADLHNQDIDTIRQILRDEINAVFITIRAEIKRDFAGLTE